MARLHQAACCLATGGSPTLQSFSSEACSSTNTPVAPDIIITRPRADASEPSSARLALASAPCTTWATRSPATPCTCSISVLST
jgi:hypothetical protein